MSLDKILEVYFTSRRDLIPFLESLDKRALIASLSQLIDTYANDVNSSSLREQITLLKAGYRHLRGKLGYNGESPEGKPCDVKPINIKSNSGKKLNGGGNFSDFTYERFNRYLEDGVVMLVSGFVDGHLVYILEFPFFAIEKRIREQLDRFFTRRRRKGEYLRSANFTFKDYKGCPNLRIVYKHPEIKTFEKFLTRELYNFLREG